MSDEINNTTNEQPTNGSQTNPAVINTYMPYTYTVDFTEFAVMYNGLLYVWIGDGTEPVGQENFDENGIKYYSGGVAGQLYGRFSDGMIQAFGFVSDYAAAKAYFEEHGIQMSMTYEEWVEYLSNIPEYAATSLTEANRSAVWATGSSSGNGSATNNSKYWAEQSKSFANGTDLDGQAVQARATDNAEYFKDLAKDWATKTTAVETGLNSAKTYAENANESRLQAESWAQGTRDGTADTERQSAQNINSKKFSEVSEEYSLQAESWTQGTRNGSADATRQNAGTNNAKYYYDETIGYAIGYGTHTTTNAKLYSEQAADSERWARGWAVDKTVLSDCPEYQQGMESAYGYAQEAATHDSNAQQWATGNTGATYASGNSAKEQADRSAVWAVGSSTGNGSASNNSKYWANESKSYTKGIDLDENPVSARATDNAMYYSQQAASSASTAERWAVGADEHDTNNAKYYSEYAHAQAESIKGARAVQTYYLTSTSGIVRPAENDPNWNVAANPEEGKYLWMKIVFTWTDNSSSTFYTVTLVGTNGTGSTTSVNGQSGAVLLYGSNIPIDANNLNVSIKDVIDGMATDAISNNDIDALFVDPNQNQSEQTP